MTAATAESIASDLAQYLREHPDVCARGSTPGFHWLRFVDGEWRAVQYSSRAVHLHSYVEGRVLDEERALEWLASNPATLQPVSEAGDYGHGYDTVWAAADEQDVFTDADRCVWCGHSERTHDIDRYQTTEDGEQWLCPDCYESWKEAGEIVAGTDRRAEA